MYDLFKIFLKSNFELLWFLEDDTILAKDWSFQLIGILENLEQTFFDVLNLASYSPAIQPKQIDIVSSNDLLRYPFHTRHAHCFIITRSGVKKFLEFIDEYGPFIGSDWILYNVRSPQTRDHRAIHFNTYFINPNTVQIAPWSEHYIDQSLSIIGHQSI